MKIHTTTRHNSHDKPVVLEAGWQVCMSSNSPSAGKIEGSTSKKNHRTAHLISQCRVGNMAPWQWNRTSRGQGEVNVDFLQKPPDPERTKILWVGRWTIDFRKVGIIDSIQNIPHPVVGGSFIRHPQGPNDGTLANQRSMALGALPRLRTWHLCRGFIAGWKIHHFGWYCWWFRNPANQLRLAAYPIILLVFLYIPGGCLGFLPSTVFTRKKKGGISYREDLEDWQFGEVIPVPGVPGSLHGMWGPTWLGCRVLLPPPSCYSHVIVLLCRKHAGFSTERRRWRLVVTKWDGSCTTATTQVIKCLMFLSGHPPSHHFGDCFWMASQLIFFTWMVLAGSTSDFAKFQGIRKKNEAFFNA